MYQEQYQKNLKEN